ncbi:MAG: hypothetical protein H0X24_20060 [Ktedonobacterales bacterium]|nr:hypothetical protein [Ktedonobacterales bacterium]
MSRAMTLSELYSLLLHIDTDEKVIPVKTAQPAPVLLNQHNAAFWVGPRPAKGTPPARQPKTPPQVRVTNHVSELLERFASARGVSENTPWQESARHWVAQRQQDVQDLATPTGRELANAVQRSWDAIDTQLAELRAPLVV